MIRVETTPRVRVVTLGIKKNYRHSGIDASDVERSALSPA